MKTVIPRALALALCALPFGSAVAQETPETEQSVPARANERNWHEDSGGQGMRPSGRGESERPGSQPREETAQSSTPPGWQGDSMRRTWRTEDAARPPLPPPPIPQPPTQPRPAPPVVSPDDHHGRDQGGWRPGDRGDDNHRRDNDRWGSDHSWSDGRSWNDNRDWQWRDRNDHRYDDRRFNDRRRDQYRSYSPYRYRGWDYEPPYGFNGRNWAFGDIMPRAWWTPDYRIDSWWEFGLSRPPRGYGWVRSGDDALLIDLYSGRVAQVVYLVFW